MGLNAYKLDGFRPILLGDLNLGEIISHDNRANYINGHIKETGRLNSLLVMAGITVYEIYVRSGSLEEHYLKLTGGAAR